MSQSNVIWSFQEPSLDREEAEERSSVRAAGWGDAVPERN